MSVMSIGMRWIGAIAVCSQIFVTASAQQSGAAADSSIKAQGATSDSSTKAQGAGKTEQLESIVVTATKRKEDVTKVPLSVTVIGGDALEEQHITNIADLTRSVPNLSFSGGAAGGGSGLSTIELRGISSQAGSSTVGVYLDDVSMTRAISIVSAAPSRNFSTSTTSKSCAGRRARSTAQARWAGR